ncbi:MAG TPA: bifunctional DNA-binding transcriptional regulator/O6-methylguanine-DNA methyltransferase Ada [Gemmatimonadaceae bacterium]|nr:bifunctional DNA-binding transcriptional regulator/O6-methylguanine-DNA methyltransferase Ada [Gemmatimonadaceae bacterium]
MRSTIPDTTTAWRAVQQRDRNFDGRFVYGVSSTHIFCRPSCSSRRPTRSRVEFFASITEAERAGYRACKRCKPASNAQPAIERAVARAAEYLGRHREERVTLKALAKEVGVSAFHLQRAFKRALGVSPREYQDAQRRHVLSVRLRKGDTVSRATYEAGFGSSSRVYERSSQMGMTPATLRKGAAGERIQFSIVDSPLGRLLAAYTERGVCSVKIGADDHALEREFRAEFPEAEIRSAGAVIHEWITAIVEGVERGDAHDIPLDARGTAFQWRVWKELQRIPRGTTLSYTDVAKRIGNAKAVRAVARACATNPVALVIPCHRVVREDGSVGGYRWGLERKEALLDLEQSGSPGGAR